MFKLVSSNKSFPWGIIYNLPSLSEGPNQSDAFNLINLQIVITY